MQIKDKIIADLNVPESLINEALTSCHRLVRVFQIPKKNGQLRTITHPSSKLKTIQYWLIDCVLKKMPVHPAAVAYQDGLSVLDNAKRHKKGNCFLKIDLKDFFPSIKSEDFLRVLKKWYKHIPQEWKLNSEAIALISHACFDRNNSLPIGYPTSPFICNIVMYDFDEKVKSLIEEHKEFGKVVYTRYADDLIFSAGKGDVLAPLYKEVKKCIESSRFPQIKINPNKIKFITKKSGSMMVTGLRICKDSRITVHRKEKDHIRLMLSLVKKGKTLTLKESQSLIGHLSFLQHGDPSFFSNLHNKFFDEISQIKQLVANHSLTV